MNLSSLVESARQQGASDLHLEPGLPAAFRIRGTLRLADAPLDARLLLTIARELVGDPHWEEFVERRSFDLSKTVGGVRCRINILQTSRGVGLAIRLLAGFQATLERLNLHPDLKRFTTPHHGLVLVCGPTGSGKSSTLAALIQEINVSEARHVVTIESPIEYTFRPRKAYIRQREVGRDTPSFEQALIDALREDPDVLMVGEMRDPETMRLTLNASETGHLVLATVHSSTCVEALQRVVSAFPSDSQNSVAAQLADCLVGVVAQRLRFKPELNIRIPECEILVPTNPVKAHIRNRDFFKIQSVLETGGDAGSWTFHRYTNWLERRRDFFVPGQSAEPPDTEPETGEADDTPAALLPPRPARSGTSGSQPAGPAPASQRDEGGRIEIEPVEGEFGRILRRDPID